MTRKDYARKKIWLVIAPLLLTSFLILSSIGLTQQMATSMNAAYAQSSGITVTGKCGYYPELGAPDELRVVFTVQGAQPNTFYYFIETEESTGRVILLDGYDNYASEYGTVTEGTLGETYTLSWYQDFDGDYNDVGIEGNERVASDSVTCGESPPPPPAPTEIEVSINPTGTVSPRTGVATVSGTVECSEDTQVDVYGDITQRAGRVYIKGYFYQQVSCTAGESIEWSATTQDASGKFAGGSAQVNANALEVGDCIECGADTESATVKLRGQR